MEKRNSSHGRSISPRKNRNLFRSASSVVYKAGSRVEVDWEKSGTFSRWSRTKGFIAGSGPNDTWEVIRDEDLVSTEFQTKYIRPLAMDIEGFHIAAGHGYLDVVKEWIEGGGDPNSQFKGFTALHLACEMGQLEVIRYLVEDVGVDYHIGHETYGVQAFDMAFVSGSIDAIQFAVQTLSKEIGSTRLDIAKKFVATLGIFSPAVDLANVNLLRRGTLLKLADKLFPSYDTCLSADLHVKGHAIKEGDNVLYLCHRWESQINPDPEGRQFQLLREFLSSEEGSTIKYVFVDWSCIQQDKASNEHQLQMANLPTVAMLSTHCLILPDIGEIETYVEVGIDYLGMNTKVLTHPITHLSGLMERAWCKFEIIACQVTGAKLFCHFFLDRLQHEFIEIPESILHHQEAVNSDGGFAAAAASATKYIGESKVDLMHKVCTEVWHIPEGKRPCDVLKDLVYAVMAFSQDKGFIKQILKSDMTFSDMESRIFQDATMEHTLMEVANSLGDLTNDIDRILIMEALLQLLVFCMGKMQLSRKQRKAAQQRLQDLNNPNISTRSPRSTVDSRGSPETPYSSSRKSILREGSQMLKDWLAPVQARSRKRSQAQQEFAKAEMNGAQGNASNKGPAKIEETKMTNGDDDDMTVGSMVTVEEPPSPEPKKGWLGF